MAHVLLVDRVEGNLLQGEGDFDEAFVVGGHGMLQEAQQSVARRSNSF